MYMFCARGFSAGLMAYAWAKRRPAALPPRATPALRANPSCIGGHRLALAAAASRGVLGHDELPVVLDGDRVTGRWPPLAVRHLAA